MFDGRPSVSGAVTHSINVPLILQTGLAPLNTRHCVTTRAGADIVLRDDWLAKYQALLDHAHRHIQLTPPLLSSPVSSSNTILLCPLVIGIPCEEVLSLHLNWDEKVIVNETINH